MDNLELSTKIAEIEQRCKSNSHQITEIKEFIKDIQTDQKAIYSLATSVETMVVKMGNMETNLSEIKHNQEALTEEVNCIKIQKDKDTAKIARDIFWKTVILLIGIIATAVLFKIAPWLNY